MTKPGDLQTKKTIHELIKELRKEEKKFSKIKQESWIKGYKEWKQKI